MSRTSLTSSAKVLFDDLRLRSLRTSYCKCVGFLNAVGIILGTFGRLNRFCNENCEISTPALLSTETPLVYVKTPPQIDAVAVIKPINDTDSNHCSNWSGVSSSMERNRGLAEF